MILVDASVWIDHLRKSDPRLISLLEEFRVVTHPFVIGEIGLGSLRNRREVLGSLTRLPKAEVARHDEVMALIENAGIRGRGIGYIDACLLASCRLSSTLLWARDRRLHSVAAELGVADRIN